ncbi:hypothetical protein RD110_16835 [Rhodoferax koreense]|uniref:Probable membrane transporter protein n=1 Tax=Rhodoferax koreensis TaxID=1842727 RepID=A0A1P8JY22_9BURK|nr:sulfite exporter TauE/SafE family protein [Rhodoferax koreense]APW38660.1 hypothetical protein RD110_16835 [Rhodoferax koreense]
MMAQGVAVFALTAAVFMLAGLVKGVVGLGLPTVAMALLALWMAPAEAAALLVVPSLATNLWQLRPLAGLAALARRLGGMQVGIVLGTLAGLRCFGMGGAGASLWLGLALMAYAAWGLLGRPLHLSARCEPWLGPLAGAATGLVTALTGVFVLPAVVYLQALSLSREQLIQALGLSFTTSTLALALGLYAPQAHAAPLLGASALLLLPACAGMGVGQRLRQRLPVPAFRRWFFGALALLGGYIAVRALAA